MKVWKWKEGLSELTVMMMVVETEDQLTGMAVKETVQVDQAEIEGIKEAEEIAGHQTEVESVEVEEVVQEEDSSKLVALRNMSLAESTTVRLFY